MYLGGFFAYLNKIPKFLRLFWHIANILNFINTIKVLYILKKENVDKVFTHNFTGIGFLTLFFVSKFYSQIHFLHDIAMINPSGLMYYRKEDKIDSLTSRYYQKLTILFTLTIKNVVAPSNWIIKLHEKKGFFKKATKLKYFNPLDDDEFFNRTHNHTIDFIYIGLVAKHKGIDTLLKAWQDIDSNIKKDIKLKIVGKLISKDLLKSADNSILVLGEKNRSDLKKELVNSACLIMPSTCYENSPTVIYEAGIKGLNIISSDIGGAGEIARFFHASLFEASNVNELKDLIIKEIKNPQQYIIEEGELLKLKLNTYTENILKNN